MKKILFLIGLVLFGFVANAQQQIVWGYLRDSISNEPIELASITNTNKKKTVVSNNKGQFKIEVSKNDILFISAVGYHYDTVLYSGLIAASDTLQLFLVPISRNLNNVTVQNSGVNQYSLYSLER